MMTVDVIIPTYKPGKKLEAIIERLSKQTYKINKIILINTEKSLFVNAYGREDYFSSYENVEITHITKKQFDHAATRSLGVSKSKADIFICMTDDAIPLDETFVEELVSPIIKGDAVLTYGRQCVGKNSGIIERYTRTFNYPKTSRYKSLADKEELGIKTYFCSDVCAAYSRKTFDSLGGFVKKAIFNEDMIYASKVIENGYIIYYNSNARVLHSHKYTNMQQLSRNFDLGVSQAMNREVFDGVPSTKEGVKLVKDTAIYLLKKGKWYLVPSLFVTSAFKYAGFFLGKRYEKLPKKLVYRLSMNKTFWENN